MARLQNMKTHKIIHTLIKQNTDKSDQIEHISKNWATGCSFWNTRWLILLNQPVLSVPQGSVDHYDDHVDDHDDPVLECLFVRCS